MRRPFPWRCSSATTWQLNCRPSRFCRASGASRICHARSGTADQAFDLAGWWPGAQLAIVDAAGHWTFEPGNVAALRAGANALAKALAG